MNSLQEATEVIRAAEQSLRAIIVQAAEQGDYDHLPLLADWAKQLSACLDAPRHPAVLPPPVPVETNSRLERRAAPAKARATSSGARATKGSGRTRKPRKTRRKKPDYPQFLREGEVLVKVGWSRREKKTYEHKAPRSVLQALVKALNRVGADGDRFTTESLFPLKDLTDSSDIPDYQAYLALAWLRRTNVIVQHGRQGYSLPQGTDLTHEIDQLWNNLPAR